MPDKKKKQSRGWASKATKYVKRLVNLDVDF